MNIRRQLEETEARVLHPRATLSRASRGRVSAEAECDLRPCFQHDRDRILHSKTFRRLKHKTQVFLAPSGDHYRTRLTHTLEVSQIGRTIARCLRLNEDLTEAIALGHDLGHTPFGHAGEAVLNEIMPGGFRHPDQSLRVVDELECLNLTAEVRDGIVRHSKRGGPILPDDDRLLPQTLEGQIVRIADSIAYLNHDLDDALRARVLDAAVVRRDAAFVFEVLGARHSTRINTMVTDVIEATLAGGYDRIRTSPAIMETAMRMRGFLDQRVYSAVAVHTDFEKATKIIRELFCYYREYPDALRAEPESECASGDRDRDICDFISGMTDRYAVRCYEQVFLPQSWKIL